jgi:ribosomal protein S18 acetylase RimI-like enzyme
MDLIKFNPKDQKQTFDFFLGIYREFGWDERFIYGMDSIAETFGGKREIFLTAKEKEKVVGCVGLKELKPKTALMKRFYLAQNYRGSGLVKKMFDEVVKFAKQNGYGEVVLDTYLTNYRAQRFYEKNGFSVFSPDPLEKWPESQHPEIFLFYKLMLV